MFIVILYILLVSAIVIRVLSRDEMSATSRLAWFLVIVTLPLIGIIVYFLFGEVNLGSSANKKARSIYRRVRNEGGNALGQFQNLAQIDSTYRPAFAYAASINGFLTTHGNTAELMSDDATARACLIEDLDNAQVSINVLYYIWLQDETGTNVAHALIRAAKRGVECRAMADALGSYGMVKSSLWQAMKDAGVKTSVALPFNNIIKTILFSRLDLRNHRKITLIDSKITYCGSQNCADMEFHKKPKYAPWIDIALRFEGPVVAQNQLLFAEDWLIHEQDELSNFIIEPEPKSNGFMAQVWGDGPTIRGSATPHLFSTLFCQARDALIISTPYFVPGNMVLESLCAASYRGVTVIVIFPARNDSWIVSATSRSHYREMLEAGITIYEFEGGLLHSKTLTVDGKVTLIGSSNLDMRSFDLNYENNVLLQDEAITEAVRDRQYEYIASSKLVTMSDVNEWSLPQRIWQNVIATIGPVL